MPKQTRTNEDAAYFMKLRDNLHEAMAQVHKARAKRVPHPIDDQADQAKLGGSPKPSDIA